MSSTTTLLLPLLLLLLLLPWNSLAGRPSEETELEIKGDSNTCVYSVYVRTSTIWKAGTDSTISVVLNDTSGNQLSIPNLEKWGLMEEGHDYFERGNLDIFSGRAPCLASAPCAMLVSSDGVGSGHGWYCNYIEVTSTGPHLGCAQKQFTVEQWLATDAWPYKLTAEIDYCGKADQLGDVDVDLAVAK